MFNESRAEMTVAKKGDECEIREANEEVKVGREGERRKPVC